MKVKIYNMGTYVFMFISLVLFVTGKVKGYQVHGDDSLIFYWEYWVAGLACAGLSLLFSLA